MRDVEQKKTREPIAIIGIGCRFPGGVSNAETFWQLIRDGEDAITEIPKDRLDIDALYDPKPGTPGKVVTRYGGFLRNPDRFDAPFFGVSPREARRMDPQQRLLLEVVFEALEDSGQSLEYLSQSNTGVFVGSWSGDYESSMYASTPEIDIYMTTGGGRYSIAGRISYVFDFQGPSLTVDTACSSSLVTVHLAAQSLILEESDLAIAGGVNLILQPPISIAYSNSGMLSPDGRCKFGDASANGYVRSEGCGIVVLKRLSRALSDKDPIYAVILGDAVNHDGNEGLFVAPNQKAQEALLRQAYQNAGVSPDQITFVEAHGTGTNAGDPVEIGALASVLGKERNSACPCYVGSVKTNIGHTEAASGIAGLIKAAMCLKRRYIPPSLHFENPNPSIPWDTIPLKVPKEPVSLETEKSPLIAGVNSFGVSGTNAHVVLKEPPEPEAGVQKKEEAGQVYLLPLSARSNKALEELRQTWGQYLEDVGTTAFSLYDVCYGASVRRSHHNHRLVVVGRSRAELIEELRDSNQDGIHSDGETSSMVDNRDKGMVFVFSGQGPQWYAMGRELFDQEKTYRDTVELCSGLLKEYAEWNLIDELGRSETASRLGRTEIAQPALFSLQMALSNLWRSWGIEPSAVIGHSIGEVAAACFSGVLSLEEAVRVVYHRGRLLQRADGLGKMAAVEISLAEAESLISDYRGRLTVAANNSPCSVTLSGEPKALKQILEHLEGQGVFCRMLPVNYAFHSSHITPYQEEMIQSVEGISPESPTIPIISTVTGTVASRGEYGAEYWAKNIRQPVQFASAVDMLIEQGHRTFIEISPHPVLAVSISQCLAERNVSGSVLPSLRRGKGEKATILETLGSLYVRNHQIDWRKLYPRKGDYVRLPSYLWQRESYWYDGLEKRGSTIVVSSQNKNDKGHPIMGQCRSLSTDPGTHIWELNLRPAYGPFLREHGMQGLVIMPAALFLEMALSGVSELYGAGNSAVESMSFKEALILSEDVDQKVQMVFTSMTPESVSCQFFSQPPGADHKNAPWTLHVEGVVRIEYEDSMPKPAEYLSLKEVKSRFSIPCVGKDYYDRILDNGYQYGQIFQCIETLCVGESESLGQFRLPSSTWKPDSFLIPPNILDACIQLLVSIAVNEKGGADEKRLFLPVTLGGLRLYRKFPSNAALWGHAIQRTLKDDSEENLCGDIFLLDEEGHVIAEIRELQLKGIERNRRQEIEDWLFGLEWRVASHPEWSQTPFTDDGQNWLIFADQTGVGEAVVKRLQARNQHGILVFSSDEFEMVSRNHFRINPTSREDFKKLIQETMGLNSGKDWNIVYLWALDAEPFDEVKSVGLVETQQQRLYGSALFLAQTLAQITEPGTRRLWLATQGGVPAGSFSEPLSVLQGSLFGFARVVALELPELGCTLVDLDPDERIENTDLLLSEILSGEQETLIAFRNKERYVARLARLRSTSHSTPEKLNIPASHPFQLQIPERGLLDNLVINRISRRRPKSNEVEIQVLSTGLNFRDVLNALDMYPGDPGPLGLECAGRIVAVGDDVKDFKVGDNVIALALGCFSNFVTVNEDMVAPKPEGISFEEAATVPVVFLTAYHTMVNVAKIKEGERILIHAASGGIGMAAVQIAQQAGAEIFGTAGSPEKRNLLKELGVHHVMNSRTLDFADEILEVTDGKGVDIVINSLTGDFISKSVSVLGSKGRFLELGKIGIWTKEQVQELKRDCLYCVFDLVETAKNEPGLIKEMFQKLVGEFNQGNLRPLSLQIFPMDDCIKAFRTMSNAKHTGKIVISQHASEIRVDSSGVDETVDLFHSDGVYLITGGFGGLGLLIAQWMIKNGARSLALMGRSGPTDSAKTTISKMEKAGATVLQYRGDVSRQADLIDVLQVIRDHAPPLRGIIHCAGAIDDGVLLHQEPSRFAKPLSSKILGAYNLHSLTKNLPLDFFVFFSSFASILGSPGQINYATANAFMDALAHYRKNLGLPALSVNWGPWSEVGMAASSKERGERLASRGILNLTPDGGLEVLRMALERNLTQLTAMPFDLERWREANPAAKKEQLFEDLSEEARNLESEELIPHGDAHFKRRLEEIPQSERKDFMISFVSSQAVKVLGIRSGVSLDSGMSFKDLGLDSLMAVELKNALGADTGLGLQASVVYDYPTIDLLAEYLHNELTNTEENRDEDGKYSEKKTGGGESHFEELDSLTQDELADLLSEKLSLIDEE